MNDFMSAMPGGPGGVSITGKWVNRRTGKTVFVRDNIIAENGMQLICQDGSMISMTDFSRDYIQASDDIYNEDGQKIGTEEVTTSNVNFNPTLAQASVQLPPEITSYNDVLNMVIGEEQPIVNEQSNVNIEKQFVPQNKISPTSTNYQLIDKLFNKINSQPKIDININWAVFPTTELKTLIDYLDVTEEEIANYIYNNFVNPDNVKTEIASKISVLLSEK